MKRQSITAMLNLQSDLHVGTGKSTGVSDDLVYRNANGEVLIPGTSIAGALRAVATRLAPHLDGGKTCIALQTDTGGQQHGNGSPKACSCLTCTLFGALDPREEATQGSASRLRVYDAELIETGKLAIRDGVGIDRITGAAARNERLKFDYEVVQAGAKFLLRMEIDQRLYDSQKSDQALALLSATLAEWQAGRSALGGRTSRGLGAFSLLNVRWDSVDLTQPQALFAFLQQPADWSGESGDETWLAKSVDKARQTVAVQKTKAPEQALNRWAQLELRLAVDGPFLVNDQTEAVKAGFDHAPLLRSGGAEKLAVLPGSSLRGVLRSQAERIARTMATLDAWGDSTEMNADAATRFVATCPACNPLISDVSGPVASCSSHVKGLSSDKRETIDRMGAEEQVCLACRLFGSTWNGSRLRVEDAVMEHVSLVSAQDPRVLDFLAIDRFTGGGRDSAKYDAAVFWNPTFRVRIFLENPESWELGWLFLALRDLHDGLTTVGFGGSKGFGRSMIQEIDLTLGAIDPADALLIGDATARNESGLFTTGRYSHVVVNQENDHEQEIPASIPTAWQTAITDWLEEFQTKVAGFRRETDFVLKQDSYFGGGRELTNHYPARVRPKEADADER